MIIVLHVATRYHVTLVITQIPRLLHVATWPIYVLWSVYNSLAFSLQT